MLRVLGIMAAVAVAAGLFALTITGTLGLRGEDGGGDEGTAIPLAGGPDRDDPGGGLASGDLMTTQIGYGQRGRIQQADPQSGRLIREFRYERLDPRPAGNFAVAQPEARLYIAPHRVIRLKADAGTVYAPGNVPQEGAFTGDCIVQIFQAPPDQRPVIADDSADLTATITLDDANFDTVQGEIDSTGAVVVEARHARFRGRGLTLRYNEPLQRIEYLEITHGDYLTYRAPQVAPDESAGAGAGDAGDGDPAADVDADQAEIDYYRVEFERNIRVNSEGNTVEAEHLSGIFAFRRSAEAVLDPAGGARSARPRRRAHDALATAGPMPDDRRALARRMPDGALALAGDPVRALALALASTTRAQAGASPRSDMPRELTMTWQGSMVVKPLEQRPLRLTTPDDFLLQFDGRPVIVRGDDEATVTCARLEYHKAPGRLTALSSEAHPLRMEAPSLGVAHVRELRAFLDDDRVELWGEGSLRAAADAREGGRGLPPGFEALWSQRVDLRLSSQAEGVDSATFFGDVRINDPRLTMRAQKMLVQFAADADGSGRHFARIEATGDVLARGEPGYIRADYLALATTERDGDVLPESLTAIGNVTLGDGKQSLVADKLNAEFDDMPVAAADAGDAAADGEQARRTRRDLAEMRATGDVQATLGDGARVKADMLRVNNRRGTALLTGKLVTVVRDDAELQVSRLELKRDGEQADALGAGRFVSVQPAADGGAPRRLEVRWTRHMTYSQSADLLEVVGDVHVEHSDAPTELNTLSASELSLELLDEPTGRATGGGDAATDGNGDQATANGLGRERALLRRLVANGDVVLRSTRYHSDDRKRIASDLQIKGPRLEFDNRTERARVIGPGSMAIVDHRPQADAFEAGQVRLSGRGATAFTWQGGLLLDAQSTDMIMDRAVVMMHRPRGGNELIELQTRKLVADMRGLGQMKAMQMTRVEGLDIDHIEALGHVRLRQIETAGEREKTTRLISAHRIYYDGQTRQATLDAQPGGRVQIVQSDQPKPIRAARIIWDLQQDRVQIDEAGY